ncbi:coth protein-domain-containing protein [Sporodiniella umbellata]|nr:coth protein-domain-containing protein [Sporodiniella umbellata]
MFFLDCLVATTDGIPYTLSPNKTFPIIYTAIAPIAQVGYQYEIKQKELFVRSPSPVDTQHEFFGRNWNTLPNLPLPQLYPSLFNRTSSRLHRQDEIPTLHFMADQGLVDNLHHNLTAKNFSIPSTLYYIAAQDRLVLPHTLITLSGQSSRTFPKLAYTLRLQSPLYGYTRLKLRALTTDPSYMREQLTHNFLRSVGLVSSEFSYIRLVINKQPIGLFGMVDTIGSHWLKNVFGQPSKRYRAGPLYEGIRHTSNSEKLGLRSDLSYMTNVTYYSAGQYQLRAAKKKGFQPLQGLTKFIANAPSDVRAWNKQLHTESFLRAMALEVLLGYSDGYLTMCDNFYLYQNPKNKQFIYIPTDLDLTIGNTFFSMEDIWSGDYNRMPAIHSRPLFVQMMRVPAFQKRFEEIVQEVNIRLVNPAISFSHFKRISDLIRDDVLWDRSLPRVKSPGEARVPDNANTLAWIDMGLRLKGHLPFELAVDGPTGHISLPSIKDWFFKVYQNTARFYTERKKEPGITYSSQIYPL